MRFLQPDMAIWLLGMPLAFGAWYFHLYAKRRFRDKAVTGQLAALSSVSRARHDWIALVAALMAIGFLSLALMRPQLILERRTPEYERQDLVLILDRSASMRAQDIAPSRFTRAVLEIKAFLMRKPEAIDRVGLVGFAGTSLMVSHLTRDPGSLFFYLDWIQEDDEPQYGTDIGAALATAREMVRKDGRPTKKIFLLLSDGEQESRELADVVATLRDERTPVYTIGIGSDSQVRIPVGDDSGTTGFLQDEEGAFVFTRFNETTLREIATLTGGRYVRSITGHELLAAMQSVVERERRQVGWKTSREYRDLYFESLGSSALATLILLLTL